MSDTGASADGAAPSAGFSDLVRKRLNWVPSKTIGRVTEIAVLSPVRKGRVPGERRTYEERLRDAVANIAARHAQGLPTELGAVPEIHFGRVMMIRPEQYLVYSQAGDDVIYYQDGDLIDTPVPDDPDKKIPIPFDEYLLQTQLGLPANTAQYRTWVLTAVEFDGDLKVYFRDIARFLGRAFDSIFENCENFPGTTDFELFWQWIRRYQINSALFYAPYSNMTVVRLRQLELFKRRFDEFVARVRTPTGPKVRDLDDVFDEFLRENQQIPQDFPTVGGMFTWGQPKQGG